MNDTLHFLGISGSLRRQSRNTGLLRCAARSLPEGVRWLCPHCRWDMPLTGYAAEHDNPVARKFCVLVPVQAAASLFFFTRHGR
mgnify:CR=1 FL=1